MAEVEALYGWVSDQDPGGPALCSVIIRNVYSQLVTSERSVAEREFRQHAAFIARATKCPVRLVQFTRGEVLETIG